MLLPDRLPQRSLNRLARRRIRQQLLQRLLVLESVEQLLILESSFKKSSTLAFGERVGSVPAEQLSDLLVLHLLSSLVLVSQLPPISSSRCFRDRKSTRLNSSHT